MRTLISTTTNVVSNISGINVTATLTPNQAQNQIRTASAALKKWRHVEEILNDPTYAEFGHLSRAFMDIWILLDHTTLLRCHIFIENIEVFNYLSRE